MNDDWPGIMPYIQKLCKLNPHYKDKAAESMGFRNYESIEKLFDVFYQEPTTIINPDGSFINEKFTKKMRSW